MVAIAAHHEDTVQLLLDLESIDANATTQVERC